MAWRTPSREKLASLAALTFALFLFSHVLYQNYFILNADHASMAEMIDTTAAHGLPLSQIQKQFLSADANLPTKQTAEAYCAKPLPPDDGAPINFLKWHNYAIFYVIAPLRLLLSAKVILALIGALSFVGMLALLYATARRLGVPIVAALGFIFLVTAHPGWSQSLFGEFYPDKLFLLFGLLYVIAVVSHFEKASSSRWLIVATGVLATLCTERAGIMICAFTIACTLLYRGRRIQRGDVLPLTVAAAAGLYALAYMLLIQSNPQYTGFAGSMLDQARAIFGEGPTLPMQKLLLVNALGLGLLACLHWRLGLIAAAAMLPNLLGDHGLGAATKIGWPAHYHVLYFTFLVAAALYGLVRFHRRFPDSRASLVSGGATFLFGTVLLFLSPYEVKPLLSFSWANLQSYAPLKVAELAIGGPTAQGVAVRVGYVRAAAAAIPAGASVSAVGGMIPALYDAASPRVLQYYPLGIDGSDYVAVPYQLSQNGQPSLSGVLSVLGPAVQKAIDECIQARLVRNGYRASALIPAVPGGSWGIAVLRRGLDEDGSGAASLGDGRGR